MSVVNDHVKVVNWAPAPFPRGFKSNWLANAQVTLNSVAVEPLIIIREKTGELNVLNAGTMVLFGVTIDARKIAGGLPIDDPSVTGEAREKMRAAVLAEARARGIQ